MYLHKKPVNRNLNKSRQRTNRLQRLSRLDAMESRPYIPVASRFGIIDCRGSYGIKYRQAILNFNQLLGRTTRTCQI